MRRLVPLVLCLIGSRLLGAQSIFDASVRGAPQFISYKFGTPSDQTISEFAVPIYVLVPVTSSLAFDVGTAYASVQANNTAGATKTTSSISGLTDTQLRMNYAIGTDFVVVTAGVNLPTGRATATPEEQSAASLIASDFLTFPITSLGTGLGGTGGVAMARPLGDWSLGLGVSMRASAAYDPYELSGGAGIRYQPGDEFRARAGLDHPFGTGHIAFGETFSRFGNDELDSSIYNTGDRWITEASVSNSVAGGDFLLSAWDLYRVQGTLADGTISGSEHVTDVSLVYGFAAGNTRVEPMIEGRSWVQAGQPTSAFGTVGVRINDQWGAFGLSPSVGYTVGNIAAETTAGALTKASLTGFRAQLTIILQ